MNRIEQCFARAKSEKRAAFGVFISAGDPDLKTSQEILLALPDCGVDFVELGMPFSDPMADGKAIQASSQRALKAGATLEKTLKIAGAFRKKHPEVPLILMGYFNPIYIYGTERFIDEAKKIGVDGVLVVDLPPEEDSELYLPAKAKGLDMIRLITPTSDEARLKKILKDAKGFVYYVSITGITGAQSASADSIKKAVNRIKAVTPLPCVVGFGMRSPEQIAQAAPYVDGVVVGSAIVETIASSLDKNDALGHNTIDKTLALTLKLAKSTKRI